MAKKRKWQSIQLVVVMVALAYAAGCSKAAEAIETIEAIGEAEQGTATITKDDGEQITVASKPDIPELFPSDVPLPDEIQVTSSISGSDSVTVMFETEKAFAEVVDMYIDYTEQAGYTEVHRLEAEGMINYSAQRGTERFVFTIQLDLENNKTVTGALVYSNRPDSE